MPCTAMTFSFFAPVLSAQGTTASTPTARDILPMFGRYTVFPAMVLSKQRDAEKSFALGGASGP